MTSIYIYDFSRLISIAFQYKPLSPLMAISAVFQTLYKALTER
jgi:hypothetical protein